MRGKANISASGLFKLACLRFSLMLRLSPLSCCHTIIGRRVYLNHRITYILALISAWLLWITGAEVFLSLCICVVMAQVLVILVPLVPPVALCDLTEKHFHIEPDIDDSDKVCFYTELDVSDDARSVRRLLSWSRYDLERALGHPAAFKAIRAIHALEMSGGCPPGPLASLAGLTKMAEEWRGREAERLRTWGAGNRGSHSLAPIIRGIPKP